MVFSKFFQKNWGENKIYLESKVDLKLLLNQVIYVEDKYNSSINKVIAKNHDKISLKLKRAKLSADFVYLPIITKQIQQQNASLKDILDYYFPNIRAQKSSSFLSAIPQTYSISKHLFSFFSYQDNINPGFLRYMGKDKDDSFVYEYFKFKSKRNIIKQINYYTDTLSHEFQYSHQTSIIEENVLFGDEFDIRETPEYISKENKTQEEKEEYFLFEEERFTDQSERFYKKRKEFRRETEKRVFKHIAQKANDLFDDDYDYFESEQYNLITQIKSDIQNLKELGFYDILLKEIGSVLFENEKDSMFQPSRLVIDNEFNISLPDFNNMTIEMTPLPKSLFILFLRHPGGINLKELIDYKIELLEIYKLLSYRETYFNMTESVNRICNPFEGSINEKLSRIKEAFLKKMSIDTAKYYIVKGERGAKKKIEIDRSLVVFPNALMEIGLTKTLE